MGEHTHSDTKRHQALEPCAIYSPNNSLSLKVGVNEHAEVWYELSKGAGSQQATIIRGSKITAYTVDDVNILNAAEDIHCVDSKFDDTWEQPWGEQRFIRNNYTELALQTASFTVRFRLFDDSFGFRYEVSGEGDLVIKKELTEFNFNPASKAWWIPALGQNHYEHQFKQTDFEAITTAHTPLTLELADGTFAAIHEAALYNFGAMNIVPTKHGLLSSITPLNDGTVARVNLPFQSPWRTVILSDTAAGLGLPKIMLNLNEPSKITDTSWVQPMKFMGIWWGMFIGVFTWSSGERHGATTANAFKYINAAKRLGIRGLLIEGWNEGWDGDWTQNGDSMNHFKPYPDFDIQAISSYAAAQGVEIVGHHETSGSISHYESELPEAYDYYKHFGVRYIKTGYVSPRMDNGEFHSSQAGVRHYQKTVELAAERQVMLDIHEPVKGTGIERTWPNLMTREGVMGQEYEGGAVLPEHTATLPFTRLLAGPLDYTPGLFNLSGTSRKVQTTLAKQLAFYVTMYSPMQMVADLPEHYFNQPAFEFIKAVPVNWETTLPLDGVIGDYYVVARKDRETDAWFVGGVSDEQARTLTVSLDFLPEHRTFELILYKDAEDAHWQLNPEAIIIETRQVTSTDTLSLNVAPGGGFALHMQPDDEVSYPYPTL